MKNLCKLLLIIAIPLNISAQVQVRKTDSASITSVLRFLSPDILQNAGAANYSITIPSPPAPVIIPQSIIEDSTYDDQDDTTYDYIPVLDYGTVLNTNLQMSDGNWQNTSSGKVWALKIFVNNAFNTSVHIDSFCLSPTASFYIVSGDLKMTKGPFTKESMANISKFGTFPMDGSSCYLFLFEPDQNSATQDHFIVSGVVGGYQPVGEPESPIAISSSTVERPDPVRCIPSIRCYPDWMNSARAVSRWTNGAGRLCSGTLLNNENFNGVSFYYSAHHCLPPDAVELVRAAFQFQFWQTGCNTGTNEPGIEFFGATLIHDVPYNSGDAILLRLNDGPGVGDAPTYAGWSRQNSNPKRNSCGIIHHPQGRDMRFTQSAVVRPFLWDWDFWKVSYYPGTGLMLGGSSGSALFNSSHQVIGTLSRGFPQSCFFRMSGDRFGKFNRGWDGMRQFLSPAADNFALDELSLNPLRISGNAILTCGSDNTYAVPNLDGCTFTWTVSPNLIIVSGLNTNQIVVRYNGTNPQSDVGNIHIVINDSKGSFPTGRRAEADFAVASGIGVMTGTIIQVPYANPLNTFNIVNPNTPSSTDFTAINATATTATQIGGTGVWNFAGGAIGHLFLLLSPGESATFRLTATSPTCGITEMNVTYLATMGGFFYRISPNPAGNLITVTPVKDENDKSNPARRETDLEYYIKITDIMTGMQVVQTKVNKGEVQKQIDVSAFKRGHYAVQIIDGANISTHRLLLQ